MFFHAVFCCPIFLFLFLSCEHNHNMFSKMCASTCARIVLLLLLLLFQTSRSKLTTPNECCPAEDRPPQGRRWWNARPTSVLMEVGQIVTLDVFFFSLSLSYVVASTCRNNNGLPSPSYRLAFFFFFLFSFSFSSPNTLCDLPVPSAPSTTNPGHRTLLSWPYIFYSFIHFDEIQVLDKRNGMRERENELVSELTSAGTLWRTRAFAFSED